MRDWPFCFTWAAKEGSILKKIGYSIFQHRFSFINCCGIVKWNSKDGCMNLYNKDCWEGAKTIRHEAWPWPKHQYGGEDTSSDLALWSRPGLAKTTLDMCLFLSRHPIKNIDYIQICFRLSQPLPKIYKVLGQVSPPTMSLMIVSLNHENVFSCFRFRIGLNNWKGVSWNVWRDRLHVLL